MIDVQRQLSQSSVAHTPNMRRSTSRGSTPKKRLLERSKKAATKAATYLAYDTHIIVSYNVQPTALLGVLQNKFSI